MNNYANLKKKLAECEKVQGTAMSFFYEPMLIERMKRDDLDFILFDMEHGRFNSENLLLHLYMCRTFDIPSIVRVQDTAYHLISKTIDMGADGIMLPRTESADQIKSAVDAIYCHPVGKKGNGGYTQLRKNESIVDFQEGRILLPQIESPKGIEALPNMLEKFREQISGIIVGPYDMSVMVGTPGEIHSDETQKSVAQVFRICREYKKSVGIYCFNIEECIAYKKMGANIFWLCTDVDFFIYGFNCEFDALSKV